MNVVDDFLREMEGMARGAGRILMSHFGRLEDADIGFKGRRDLQTKADAESEAWSDDDPGEADPFSDAQPVPDGAEEPVEFGEVEGDDEFAEFDEIS